MLPFSLLLMKRLINSWTDCVGGQICRFFTLGEFFAMLARSRDAAPPGPASGQVMLIPMPASFAV
jgi:hypothetical protein